MRWNLLRSVIIYVILGLEAVAIYHVGTSDRPVIMAAGVVGIVGAYYVTEP